MKKFFALLLGLCLTLNCVCASAATFGELQDMLRSGSSEETPVESAGAEAQSGVQMTFDARDGLTVVDGNCIICGDDYSSFIDCYVYAVIRNDSDSAMAVEGAIIATDAQGNTLEEQNYLFANPEVLAPGDMAVISDYVLISKSESISLPEHVAGVTLMVNADPYAYSTEAPTSITVDVEMAQDLDIYGDMVDVVRFTMTNDSGAPLRNLAVAAALYDTEGRLVLTVEANTGYDTVILPEGGTLIIESELYSYVTEYLAQTGRELATLGAIAYGD